MPSPFPGMDPFIEGQVWEDFHTHFCDDLARALVRLLRPRYLVRSEHRVYVETPFEEETSRQPDVVILGGGVPSPLTLTASAEDAAPLLLTLPEPVERREVFLTVREPETLDVVTVIELLSPTNKRTGSSGRVEYLQKRSELIRSASHLVELDLLRGGERLPTIEPLPQADYFIFVSRPDRRPKVEVFQWRLTQPFPRLPVPLKPPDPDVQVDLAAAFQRTYDEMGYDYGLDYRAPVRPPLSAAEAEWVAERLRTHPPAGR